MKNFILIIPCLILLQGCSHFEKSERLEEFKLNYNSNKIFCEGTYKLSKGRFSFIETKNKSDIWKCYFPNGELRTFYEYDEDGELVNHKQYNLDGMLIYSKIVNGDTVLETAYYESGDIEAEAVTEWEWDEDEEGDGTWYYIRTTKKFYKNGELKQQYIDTNGEDGKLKIWNENGILQIETDFDYDLYNP